MKMKLLTMMEQTVDTIMYDNDQLNERISATRLSVQRLQHSCQDMRKKIRFYNDKIVFAENKIERVETSLQKKTQEFSEKVNILEDRERQIEYNDATACQIREKKEEVNQQIKDEIKNIEELKKLSTAGFHSEVEDEDSKNNDHGAGQFVAETKACFLQSLQKQLGLKEQTVLTIQPVLEYLNGKIYFRTKKRQQRKELRSLNEKLQQEILYLNKAINLLQ